MQGKNILALLVLAVAIIGFFALTNREITGFFSLGEKNNPVKNNVQQGNNSKETENRLGADLSFEVIKKSELSARLFLQNKIPVCPETTDANILIENKGNEKIEALKIKSASQLQIRACADCIIGSLGVGESKIVLLKICNNSGESQAILVSSANTEPVEIKIEKTR